MATTSPFARPYAADIKTFAQGGDGLSQFQKLQNSSFGANALANRQGTPMGRSANDINRIAEQQRRRGNFQPMMHLGMMDRQQQFYDQQNDKNFAQGLQMWQMNQQAGDARDQQQRAWQAQDWQRNQAEQQRQEEARRQWELQMHGLSAGERAMEQERQRRQEEMDRQRVPNVNVIPYGGTGYGATIVDGRPMGNVPLNQAPAPPSLMPVPGTNYRIPMQGDSRIPGAPMLEATPNPGWSVKGQPKETLAPVGGNSVPKIQHFEKDGIKVPHEYNPKTGRWRPVQFEDANGDGIPDAPKGAGATTAPVTTKSGYQFRMMPAAQP